ncbi:MAG: dienelactone hydrolase family protein [Sediminibacterium sp.]|nr:dienelactone hydrolase family protein [Sediminibacterium sp.]MBX9781227.1 dienelactone hydrolase family protein [Chitinophagaceae bacterium]
MKKILSLTLAAIITAGILSYRQKSEEPAIATPGCYVSCFTDVRDQFRAEASTAAFAAMHENPYAYVLENPTGSSISFPAADGKPASGYFIKSKKKTKNWIFVIQEWWGLNDHIKREAETLAAELGNVNVLALDMYDGGVAATPDSAMKLMQAAKTPRLEAIVNAALAYAGTDAKIFTIGWCFGGMWSLQSSLLAGKQAAGCVMYYGRPENNLEKLKGLNCDVIGFFGNLDRSPSPEVVNKFEADMAAAGKKLETHKYEAGHGFSNPSNPSFNKEATADSHAKTIAFLKARL